MSPQSWLVRHGLVASMLLAVACRPPPQPAPYPGGSAPDIGSLLAAASPTLGAIAVPKAKIKLGVHRGNLAFLAQSPVRFRGSVTVAGNEMVSLSLHEEGYHLVNKLDGIPTGYYEGPPSACAVAALLGVGLDGERLVSVVLGGAPLIADFRVTEHGWDEKRGRERVLLQNARYREELLFRYDDGTWRFGGATLWRADGSRLWTVTHEAWQRVDGHVLPKVTRLSRPGKRKDEMVTIEIREVNTDPPWARTATPPDETGGDDGGGDDGGAWENEGDGGAWENADEERGWENEEANTAESEAEPEPKPAPAPAPAATPPPGPPGIWKLGPGGLPRRGDLCARKK